MGHIVTSSRAFYLVITCFILSLVACEQPKDANELKNKNNGKNDWSVPYSIASADYGAKLTNVSTNPPDINAP